MKSYNILNITPEQEREFREDQEKEVKLAEALDTRIAFVAYTLIGINVIVFILTSVNGVPFRDPQAGDLLPWGADYGPLTTHGEWWRLLTAMFLHFGVYHLAVNMAVLASVGPLAERLFGKVGFIVLYMFAGIGGNIASLTVNPVTTSAGASGAIFGIYGGLFGLFLRQRRSFPVETLRSQALGAALFIGYNTVYAMGKPGIDMAAHVGGLLAGFGLGLALARPVFDVETGSGWRRSLMVAAGGAALTVAFIVRTAPLDDFGPERVRLAATQQRVLAIYGASLEKWKAKEMSDREFAEVVEQQLLPPWSAERTALLALSHLPAEQKRTAHVIGEFMEAQGDGWTLMAQGLRKDDTALIARAVERMAEAKQLLAQIDDTGTP
jgi:rhomboid protease GluP